MRTVPAIRPVSAAPVRALLLITVALAVGCGGPDALPVRVTSAACGPVDVWMTVNNVRVLDGERAEPTATGGTDRPADGQVRVGIIVVMGPDEDELEAYIEEALAPGEPLQLVVDCGRGHPRVLH